VSHGQVTSIINIAVYLLVYYASGHVFYSRYMYFLYKDQNIGDQFQVIN